MIYENMRSAMFLSRPNRFIAHIEIEGKPEIAHVKNTGRCKELLVPGATIYVQEFLGTTRKTKYDIIAVQKGERLINMDSQVTNKIFAEYVMAGKFVPDITWLKPEHTYGDSRFDFYIEAKNKKIYVEVKGATLEEEGVCRFPDAPTQRGVKHLRELTCAVQNGYEAWIVFIIQMETVHCLRPYDAMHREFGDALRQAAANGVHVMALSCKVTENSICVADKVKVELEPNA